MSETIPERVGVLRSAEQCVARDRNASYGDPTTQLGLAGEIKHLLRNNALRELSPAEWEALDSIVTKLSRWVIGDNPGRDTCVDICGYASIMWEAYLRAHPKSGNPPRVVTGGRIYGTVIPGGEFHSKTCSYHKNTNTCSC